MIVLREARWKTFSLKNQQLDNVITLQITDCTGQLYDLQKRDYLESFKGDQPKGWGQSAKLGKHSAIWGKLGTALQAYALNPCTKFAANPTSRKVKT